MGKITVIVPQQLAGERLDKALSLLYPEHSRARLQSWIKAGNVAVDNKVLRQKDTVKAGQSIVVIPEFEPDERHSGEAIPLDIIHEDREILIINKPAGLIVHPGAGNPEHTLLNALLYYHSGLEQVARAGIVQRLDKDTSGIMVIAKTPTVHTYLVRQLRDRNIHREYQAVVTGAMTGGGRIEAPIGRHHLHRKHMAVVASGKPAITHYRIIKKYPAVTHLMVRLETGRTHQIRVHMAHLHHPVIGDPVYGGRRRLPANIPQSLAEVIRAFPRQALHAFRIELVHPASNKLMRWTAPLPADMRDLIDALENGE